MWAPRIVSVVVLVLSALPVRAQTNYSNNEIINTIDETINTVGSGIFLTADAYKTIFTEISRLEAEYSPGGPNDIIQQALQIFQNSPLDPAGLVKILVDFTLRGLMIDDLVSLIESQSPIDNSDSNSNTREPATPVYPFADTFDAPYSISEAQLRAWIHIPDTFTYGQKQPMILCPGTALRGGQTYAGNFRRYFADSDLADMVWLNPTSYLLGDAQVNAEMVAYAINYISGISGGRNVSVVGFSQGNVNIQWAMKYWPSARSLVSDFIGISGDFHGTVLAPIYCSPGNPCPPAFLQQDYNAAFITTLRLGGGDTALVPSTLIYSSLFDEVVRPQDGANASGLLLGPLATNNEVQVVCAELGGGSAVLHESALGHPLVLLLAEDALKHDGPGMMDRINRTEACSDIVAPGLSVDDFITTELLAPLAIAELLIYEPKTLKEPAIMPYAQPGASNSAVSKNANNGGTNVVQESVVTIVQETVDEVNGMVDAYSSMVAAFPSMRL